MNRLKIKSKKNESGQSLVEYMIIVALVAVGSIAIMRTLSETIKVNFAKIAQSLGAEGKDLKTPPKISNQSVHKSDLKNFMNGAIEKSKGERNDDQEGTPKD